MLIIPAIDIQKGCVVRLVQGERDKKIYSKDPVKTARHWIKSGAKFLHIVDLDGAFSGTPKNLNIVKEIVKGSGVPVEFGGGARNLETIDRLLKFGVYRVVLGTKAVLDQGFLKKAFRKFKNKIIISLDAKADSLLVKGWKGCGKAKNLLPLACGLKEMGFKQVIYTDILKDGTLSGPNTRRIKSLLKGTGLHIIASGGISSLEDIYKLKMLEKQGLTGIIIGKALYEGRFTLPQALKIA